MQRLNRGRRLARCVILSSSPVGTPTRRGRRQMQPGRLPGPTAHPRMQASANWARKMVWSMAIRPPFTGMRHHRSLACSLFVKSCFSRLTRQPLLLVTSVLILAVYDQTYGREPELTALQASPLHLEGTLSAVVVEDFDNNRSWINSIQRCFH